MPKHPIDTDDHIYDVSKRRKLVGFDNFKRNNPRSDKFEGKS